MDLHVQKKFMDLWKRYFKDAELPITFFYTSKPGDAEPAKQPEGHHCMIAELNKVRKGKTLAFNKENVGCGGGRRYSGFSQELRENFPYFLSCGIPNKMEGERYKMSPHIVSEMMKHVPRIDAEDQWLVFKRWDKLTEMDEPEVVIFFVDPDVLAGLFTLANFDRADPDGVRTPMSSGCGSIILYPYIEKTRKNPLSIIGMFDPSARPYVPSNKVTFATPMNRFDQLIEYMEESFLISDTWKKVSKRMEQ